MNGLDSRLFRTLITLLISGILQSVSAQHSPSSDGLLSIRGVITDHTYGDPMAYAYIQLGDSARAVYSQEDGSFVFDKLSPGIYHISVHYLGYISAEVKNIRLVDDQSVYLEIEIKPKMLSTQEIFVTASKKTQNISLAAASTELVVAEDILRQNLRTFDQALDNLNGITVTRSSGSNVQTVSIRGASEVAGGGIGNRVLLLIDGRPAISPESGGALWNLVPLHSIDRIEVVKGAYSSLFGSSAMGGVIQVITKTPEVVPSTKLHVDYGMYQPLPESSNYTGLKNFYALSLDRSGRSGRWSYLFDVAYKNNAGHRQKTSYSLFNTYSKFKYHLNNQRSIQLSANINLIHNDTPASWLSAFAPYEVADFRKDDTQKRLETNVDIFYQAIASKQLKYSSRFYFYQNDSKYIFNDQPNNDSTNVNIGSSQIVDLETVMSRRLGNISQVDLFFENGHYLLGGIDIQYDLTNGVPDSLLYGKHQAYNLAAYIQDEMSISDQLIVTAGIRADHYKIIDHFSETNISPKLSAIYHWTDNFSTRFLLGQAYRNPSIAERFIKFEQGGGLRFLPNPNLVAERLTASIELGSKWNIHKKWFLDFALFYNKYNNLISYQQIATPNQSLVYKVINLKRAIMQGSEIKLSYQKNKTFRISTGYTFLDAKDRSADRINDVLAYKIKHSFFFDLHKEWNKLSLHFNSRYRSAIQEVFIYPGSEPGAYWIHNARISYSFGEAQSAYLSIQNLTDTPYEELERYRMQGRAYSVGLHLSLF